MRVLATVRTIDDIREIDGADFIVCARIGGWPVVVMRGEFAVGDRCVYFEPDSMLPLSNPAFADFERAGRVRENPRGERCVVLRTVRLRKTLSQGLAIPLGSLMPEGEDWQVGEDVSAPLGVVKYDPPEIEVQGRPDNLRPWPDFLTRTDEERVQNMPGLFDWLREGAPKAGAFTASEKLDGTSATYYWTRDEDGIERYGACSRNNEIAHPDDPSCSGLYWSVFHDHDIASRLEHLRADFPDARAIAIQGEIIGPKVNGNRLGLKRIAFRAFNVTVDGERFNPRDVGLDDIAVPALDFTLETSMDGAIAQADGLRSMLAPDRLAEGIVWRDDLGIAPPEFRHFKVISNRYLLKTG